MTELKYALIKNNRVANVIVMDKQDDNAITEHCEIYGFDSFVYLGEDNVAMFSSYDGQTFTPPTLDYLFEIGISSENQAMFDAREAAGGN